MISVPLKDVLPDKIIFKRKLHVKKPQEEKLVDSIYEEAAFCFDPKYIYKKINFLEQPIASLLNVSLGLRTCMDGAKEGFVVICTIGGKYKPLVEQYGMHLDRFASDTVEGIAEYSAKALLNKFYKESEWALTKRFSPGYGDLELDSQKYIFSLFKEDSIDVMLTESFYMEPEKSISYIVGVKKI